jgi:hypothetical protein
MSNEEQFLKAVGRASLMAGPLFLALMLLFQYQISAPEPLPIGMGDIPAIIGSTILLVPLTMLVGACLAFPVCLVAGGILFHLANWLPLARPAALWIGVGAGAALAISIGLFNSFDDSGSLAFIVTAMACAALIRSRFHWD